MTVLLEYIDTILQAFGWALKRLCLTPGTHLRFLEILHCFDFCLIYLSNTYVATGVVL